MPKRTKSRPASAALPAEVAEQKPNLLSPNILRLYAIISLMRSINAMKPYQETFSLSGAGSSTGIVFIVYQIGQIASFPSVETAANHLPQFIGGRFLLGFGASIASAAGPTYTVELAHPAYRGTLAGMYNNFWWVGNILAGWTTYGTNAALPAVVCVFLIYNDSRLEEALVILAKYHGDGDVNSPLFKLQYRKILDEYHAYRSDKPWCHYRELFNPRAARYRIAMIIAMAFIGQWSGNNVVSYFLFEIIEAAGITSTDTQLLINAINPIFSLIAAVYGATCLDKLGRRPMMLFGLAGALVFYILLTAITTLYAVECLENRTRAKGSGLNFLFLNVAIIVNTYGISVGIKVISWKLYIIYFFFVETGAKTLEELSEIFSAPNPHDGQIVNIREQQQAC
ncbi:lactose permease [Xylariaceae sp. FL0255]|nr:lactose permease [Xylariaceae sp. FL0255]